MSDIANLNDISMYNIKAYHYNIYVAMSWINHGYIFMVNYTMTSHYGCCTFMYTWINVYKMHCGL